MPRHLDSSALEEVFLVIYCSLLGPCLLVTARVADLKGSVCFCVQGGGAIQKLWQGASHTPPAQPIVCIFSVLVFSAHLWVQEHQLGGGWCLLPDPGMGLGRRVPTAQGHSPSSGHGGAPARCRWSARCPGSTPRGPPCRSNSNG